MAGDDREAGAARGWWRRFLDTMTFRQELAGVVARHAHLPPRERFAAIRSSPEYRDIQLIIRYRNRSLYRLALALIVAGYSLTLLDRDGDLRGVLAVGPWSIPAEVPAIGLVIALVLASPFLMARGWRAGERRARREIAARQAVWAGPTAPGAPIPPPPAGVPTIPPTSR